LERSLSPSEYLRRAHRFCAQIRLMEGSSREVDRRREAFMAEQVRATMASTDGTVVVVTGGYHSLALHARLRGTPAGDDAESRLDLLDPPAFVPAPPPEGEERGLALTPYSYERLDSLTGYEAGMPNPGFYHRLWQDREAGRPLGHRPLLFAVSKSLRARKQRVSSADLIAAETCASALARLRGHAEVWRNDLVDGLTGALIKDELAAGGTHPLLDAVHEVLRGEARGVLAADTALPPLVQDLRRRLAGHDLVATPAPRDVELDLSQPADRERSRILHQLRVVNVAGYARAGGTDFAGRDDLSRLWEKWQVRWSPDFDATAIEASRYGPTLAEAAAARLAEQARAVNRSAEQGALLLLDASLAGLHALAAGLHARLVELIRGDGKFLSVTETLAHLLYLYRYDDTFGTTGRADVGGILAEGFARGLWLLEVLGQMTDPDGSTVRGVGRLLETFERCELPLRLGRAEFVGVLGRVAHDVTQGAALRGAATGALWVLGEADVDRVRGDLRQFASPDQFGDYLTGLFALAREVVQRQPELLLAIDAALTGYDDDSFLAALPSLRLAFTYFTPREKHYMARGLLDALGVKEQPRTITLAVTPEDAARALALEGRVFAAVERYGLRGATNHSTQPARAASGGTP
jgi:hypothetical protein